MTDPELEPVRAKDEDPTAPRGRGLLLAFLVAAVFWLLSSSFESPRRSTCAACRLDREEQAFLGFETTTYLESDCSRWYAANVEPTHRHIWASSGHCRRIGILGLAGYGCSVGGPISGLGKSFQLRVYQRFRDPMEAKRLFLRLANGGSEYHRVVEGLSEWVDSDAHEPWEDWWSKHGDAGPTPSAE